MSDPKPASRSVASTLFKPGQSGNPSGRPAGTTKLRKLAREYTEQAFMALFEALNATKLQGKFDTEMPDHAVRSYAAQQILDRGWGKPSTEDVVARLDAETGETNAASHMSDAELLAEAVNRAQKIGTGN